MTKEGEYRVQVSLLDLPEPTLSNILEKLPPADLCTMAQVSIFMRDRCRSDDLWDKHLKRKWGRVLGEVALEEWQYHLDKRNSGILLNMSEETGSVGTFGGVWPTLCLNSYLENYKALISLTASDGSIMALCISLESGSFWFPAQVYKNGQFALCRYHAILSYDFPTNSFHARQQYGGWRSIEINIPWERLAPLTFNPRTVYTSDCLNELKPGDHIEIQWRGSRGLVYDWWYAVVGHLESCCNQQDNCCLCVHSDILIVSFIQYPPGSIFRSIELKRKMSSTYQEQTFRGGGFYGGIRKLSSEAEIQIWRNWYHLSTPAPAP